MNPVAPCTRARRPAARLRRRGRARALAAGALRAAGRAGCWRLAAAGCGAGPQRRADAASSSSATKRACCSATRVNFELPRSVEDALNKGVPLYFVAEAEVFRDRWYWRDKRVAQRHAGLAHRLPAADRQLPRHLRRPEPELSTAAPRRWRRCRRSARWKVAEPGQIDDGERHYVEFSFRLDTSLLPRPMQIGIGGQADWALSVERTQRFN